MGTDAKLAEVVSFLKNEFPGFAITRTDRSGHETVLELKSAGKVHIVYLQHSFLETTPVEDIQERLTGFRLAPTLRDMGDFPIVLSINGCIFG